MDKQIQPTPSESVFTWKKLNILAIAHTVLFVIDKSFDNFLYPAVLLWLGTFFGMITLTILSGLISWGLVALHAVSTVDWLGVDIAEEAKVRVKNLIDKFYSKRGFWWRFIHMITYIFVLPPRIILWALNKNDFAAFCALSIFEDAFKTTAFLRHGRKGSLSRRDYKIFCASLVLTNLWWTLRWSVIIEFIKWLI